MEDRALNNLSDEEKVEVLVISIKARWAGLSAEQMFDKYSVTQMQVTLQSLDEMKMVQEFQNIRSLTFVALNINKIEGLNRMNSLQNLWLNQNNVKVIQGLDFNVNLKKLDLSSNLIEKIQGLDSCQNLENLILNQNLIENLEGLSKVRNLKVLHVAKNRLFKIGSSLSFSSKLTQLNLSGNQIGSFKELLFLAPLHNLKVLSFNDPHFLENPVCNLCNYQTYILYHLPQLTHFDSFSIMDQAKTYAQATFMKKKMYYNMRIKTIKRTASNIKRLVQQVAMDFQNKIFQQLKPIEIMLKATQREIHQRKIKPSYQGKIFRFEPEGTLQNPLDTQNQDYLMSILDIKAQPISQCLQKEYLYLQRLDFKRHSLRKKIQAVCKQNIHRLVTELETGGNIRYQQGKPTDNWYSSCADLVYSRYLNHGDGPIKVTRVTRIHNRYLRNLFQQKLQSLVDIADTSYKKNLEYLFYGVDTQIPQQLTRIVEQGFRTPEQYRQIGLPACIPLVNSVNTAQNSRLKDNESTIEKIFQLPGKMLVCKVYTGVYFEDTLCGTYDGSYCVSDIWGSAPVQTPDDSTWCVTRSCRTDPKQKIWFVFDNSLVLPEYLVEFEYLNKSYEEEEVRLGLDSEIDRAEMNSLELSLQAFMELCSFHKVNVPKNTVPFIPERKLLETVDQENIRCIGKKGEFSKIKTLDLSLNNLKTLKSVRNCFNLTQLYLSFNKIENLIDLVACSKLKHLDISNNNVMSLQSLGQLTSLVSLNCAHNQIQDIRDIFYLQSNTQLVQMVMIGNPLSFHSRYRQLLIMNLPALRRLDLGMISRDQKQKLSEVNQEITLELARSNSIIADSTAPSGLLSAGQFFLPSVSIHTIGPDWMSFVQVIQLNNQKLSSLVGIDTLPNLKKASFIGNFIQQISCISNCNKLQQLSLQDNLISKIQNISSLKHLKKLDIGKNFLNGLSGMTNMEQLSQISLQDNLIESLQGLQTLTGLMQLYIDNNQLCNLKQIAILKQLPKLIILDITGNPLTKQENFRLYVVYHLKRLKVLDGIGIQQSEQAHAKSAFGGRLTQDLLQSKLNGISPSEIRYLDLSMCKLRSFDNMFNQKLFPNVSDLNLSGNYIQDLNCLGSMPNLVKLALSRNRLQGLNSSQKRGLQAVPSLDTLDVSFNQIKNLTAMYSANLPVLRVLILSHNQIQKVEFLDKLQALRELDLSSNQIRQLDPHSFTSPLSLKFIRLDDNRIRFLSNFSRLTKLQCLQLVSNRIHQLAQIDKLKDLPALMELILTNNPITKKTPYRINIIKRLPHLMFLDTVEVSFQEREKVQFSQQSKAQPLIHIMQQPQQKIPVKVTSVNFESVFGKPHESNVGKRPSSSNTLGGVLGVTPLNSVMKPKPTRPRK